MSSELSLRTPSDWRGWFVLALSVIVVVTILAFAYSSQRHFESSVVEQFQHHHLTIVRSVARSIQERLRDVEVELRHRLANDPRVVSPDAADYSLALQEVYEELGGFVHGVYRVDTEGVILMRYPFKEERLGVTIPERALLDKVLAAPGAVMSSPFHALIGEHAFSVIAPVRKDGIPVGAVRAVVELNTLVREFILPPRASENCRAFLMSSDGVVLYHPRKENIGKSWKEIGRGPFVKGMPLDEKGEEAKEGYFRYRGDGAAVELVAYGPVEVGGQRLVLALASPMDDVAGPIERNKRRTWGFAGLLLVIAVLGAYKFTESRNRRVMLERERQSLLREKELAGEVRAAKAYLSTLLENSPDAIISTNREGAVTFYSPGAVALLGYQEEDIIGQRVAVLYESEERAREVMRWMRESGGTVAGFETLLRAKDGSLVPVLISAAILHNEEGQEAGTVGFSKDLRECKRAEKQLRQRNELLKALQRATTQFVSEEKPEDSFQRLLDVLLELTRSEYGFISEVLFTPEGKPYQKCHAISNIAWDRASRELVESAPDGLEFYNLDNLTGCVLTEQAVVISSNPANDPRAGGLPPGHPPIRAFMGIPFFHGGEMVGMAGVANRPGGYEAETAEFFAPFSSTCGVIIDAFRRGLEREQAEEEINKSYQAQRVLNSLLRISLEDTPLEEQLKLALTAIISAPFLTVEPRSGIFLVEDEPEVLAMKAHWGLSDELKAQCGRVPFGRCLCGGAAASGQIKFADCVDHRHESHCEGMVPHGHYTVPILSKGEVLGVTVLYLHEGHRREEREEEFLQAVANTMAGIIERRRAKEELRRAHEELQRAYDTLERAQASAIATEKLAALGRLTAGVSHEILNPLNIISTRFQLFLSDPNTPPEIARHIRVLEDQANRIAKITDNLLYYARQREPERCRLDLNEKVVRTLGLVEHELRERNIAVELRLTAGLPPVLANRGQIQQVVLNLLTNACDAVPDGGMLIIVTDSVHVNGQQFVELRVEDTGGGIAPEHMEKLFDPFFTTKPEGEGTGLGLSICQGIVRAHGGSIRAESKEGGGATFVVTLPLEQMEKATPD